MLVARDRNALIEVAETIRASGGRAEVLTLDISRIGAAGQLRDVVRKKWGALDILVANAGILGPLKPLHEITEEEWTTVLDTNLRANLRLIGSLHSLLSASDCGRIIAVSSAAAVSSPPLLSGYSVTKAALESALKIYACENGSTSLRVNIIDPASIRTRMYAEVLHRAENTVLAELMPHEAPEDVPTPEMVAPLFVALAEPALTLNGAVVRFREWRDANTPGNL